MEHKIIYKDPLRIRAWLETALKKEWQKYAATPVARDAVPGHEVAQAWGYVVAGYFLIEQGLKAVLHVRGVEPRKKHALFCLFDKLPAEDQSILRVFYDDFRHTFPGMLSVPFATVDQFLKNLDGTENSRGQYVGSFEWRYFLTEEETSMPLVSINVMHEVAYGCVHLIGSIDRGDYDACRFAYSRRLRERRLNCYQAWLTFRMHLPDWGQEGDRIEILWGPDYGDIYDCIVFDGNQMRHLSASLQQVKGKNAGFMMIDKRSELRSFDPEEAFQSIGETAPWPESCSDPAFHHVMY